MKTIEIKIHHIDIAYDPFGLVVGPHVIRDRNDRYSYVSTFSNNDYADSVHYLCDQVRCDPDFDW